MYTALTGAVRVTVEPAYLEAQSAPNEGRYAFAYTVTIENGGEAPVRLVGRHWRITDGQGRRQEVRGEGVVGEQPLIDPGQSFTYTSGAAIPTASGFMGGTYQMQGDNGLYFDVEIPTFSLDAPGPRRSLN